MIEQLINWERFNQYEIIEEILVTQLKTILKWYGQKYALKNKEN